MIRTIHRAKYVLAEPELLLRNAAVHVSAPGRITRVEPWFGPPPALEAEVIDWGSSVILPGLVNAHAHLELTNLENQTGEFSSFTDWLLQVMGKRRGWSRSEWLDSVKRGTRLSLLGGTTLVGDISASGLSREALRFEQLRKVIFEEAVAFAPQRASEALENLESRLGSFVPDNLLSPGASPHAPYSVSPELYRAVAGLARRKNLRIATHVAETRQELDFLQNGRGEFMAFLEGLGALPKEWKPPGCSPVAYLESLGVLDRPAVLVHCNYIDPAAMAAILARGCSVVYCPRSHDFFGHEPHPVRELLDMGVNVSLGTDSLASNRSLSILDEMRFLFRTRKDLKCHEIIRMGTLNGAVALGYGSLVGRLRRGLWADMTILELPGDFEDRDIPARILEGEGECIATVVEGNVAWANKRDMIPPHLLK